VKLRLLVDYLDRKLRHADIEDYPGARNGLQVENDGEVKRIATAVDSHEGVLEAAIQLRADLLIVHHGLFWGETTPWTNVTHRKIKLCVENNLAVYSSHLPLDAHPELGNNILLAQAIGLRKTIPFCEAFGTRIGRRARVNLTLAEIVHRLAMALGQAPQVVYRSHEKVRNVGLVTGGAGSELASAAAQGIDTFITGEGSHSSFGRACELGVNLIYGGHYLTETFGVRALSEHLARRYKVPARFIDFPSGL